MLSFRKVCNDDMEFLFKLANEPYYRSVSKSTHDISWDEHIAWFTRRTTGNEFFYIFEDNDIACGFTRFDESNDHSWFISIALDSSFRGKGLGKKMLETSLQEFYQNKKEDVYSEVHKDNIASIKIFEALGFEFLSQKDNFKLFIKKVEK